MKDRIMLAVVAILCVVAMVVVGLSRGKKTENLQNVSVERPPVAQPTMVSPKPKKKPKIAKPEAVTVHAKKAVPSRPVKDTAKACRIRDDEETEEDHVSEIEESMENSSGFPDEEEKGLTGSVAKKMSALAALVDYRSSQAAAGMPRPLPIALEPYWGKDMEEESDESSDERDEEEGNDDIDLEGEEFRKTVNLLTLAFDDPSSAVRDAAFDAMFKIPEAERSVLSLQVLGGEDDVLKGELLEIAGNAADEFSLTLLMQALDDQNGAIRDKAATRLGELLSETFSTSDEALEWWEENHGNYVFTDQGVVPLPVDGDEANGEQPSPPRQ